MKFFMMTSVAALLGAHGVAHAAPAWCGKDRVEAPDLKDLSSKDVREVLKAFVGAECAPTAEANDHRADIEKARAAWSKRLGMTEADWADAVPYAQTHDDYSIKVELKTKTLATASPLDQYAVVLMTNEPSPPFDTMYAADIFDATGKLSEIGRFAFLDRTCFDQGLSAVRDENGLTGAETYWAVCQPDFERFNLTKALDEIRADSTHDGAAKMKLRVALYTWPARFKEHQAQVQKALAFDDANKKMFEIAASARTEWGDVAGKRGKLLELVQLMDSATIAQSRKQFEGCEATTQAELADAVASTITAKSLAGLFDERDSPNTGFATKAAPVLGASAPVTLAMIAASKCAPDQDASKYYEGVLRYAPASRGPRSWAASKIRGSKLTYDKMDSKLKYLTPMNYGAAYLEAGASSWSAGGVVQGFSKKGDDLEIKLEKTIVNQRDCVKSHKTGRISRLRGDGSVEYESWCDKEATVAHDHTWANFMVHGKFAPILKTGVMFSSVGKDVIAIWPNKNAKAPSQVLGGTVK